MFNTVSSMILKCASLPAACPQFLRSTRQAILPERKKVALAHEQWVVPSFNSHVGFEAGFYDEDNAITYFD